MISQNQNVIQSDSLLSSPSSKAIDADSYFKKNTPPSNLNEITAKSAEFIATNTKLGRPVVLVTSGGTTVPLENNTVRFVDNFSAGTRGAISAEFFLKSGYSVIFLHRKHSLQPFNRKYATPELGFLDFLFISQEGTVKIKPQYEESLIHDIALFNDIISQNRLYMPTFITLSDYLFSLREITNLLNPLGPNAFFYLAAAVSDFFIPADKMVEHKIQSSEGELSLTMNQVPKFLKPLVNSWAPNSFVVSFKLETDPNLLEAKARLSLEKYGHQAVVANILHTRKNVVWIIKRDSMDKAEEIRLSDEEIKNHVEIEQYIIKKLIKIHNSFIQNSKSSS
ncbi:hypothetical protein BB560_000878 [Smittium megazygosporum]|uniref:DNA/pantothenate metabolism flavoprotein C-terminal domain-containing protein n=1 Tax=Smittium megazygosporum TaxID=133381 RepID=A0A2T9ZJ68_9FUNG|nr:hypothetical protein BB560_000878 [Smittium megazygosporum]